MMFLRKDTELPPFLMYPRFLLESNLNDTARLVYILLLDRSRLSRTKAQWQDETGRVFVFYPIRELGQVLGKTDMTVRKALGQLEEAGLIVRRCRKQGTPTWIYLCFPEDTGKENYPPTRKENFPGTRQKYFQNPVGKLPPNKNKKNNDINNHYINGLDYSYDEGESL